MLETRLTLLDEVLSAHAGALDADYEDIETVRVASPTSAWL